MRSVGWIWFHDFVILTRFNFHYIILSIQVLSYLEGVLPGVESSDGEAVTEGLGELQLCAVGALVAVCGRVEIQGASQGHLGAGDESVGGGVGVITT